MATERRYDDREVGQILHRAAELHESGDDPRALTRPEIEQVADELGIPKALVARATTELAAHDTTHPPAWHLGGKTDLTFEHTVAAHVDDDALVPMLEFLRRTTGDTGELRHDAGARIWSSSANSKRSVTLSVVEHAGRTTFRLDERMSSEANMLVGASTFAAGVIGFFTLVLVVGPLAFSAALLGWLAGRVMWKRRSTEREAQLRRAFAAIVALAEQPESSPPAREENDPVDR